MTYLSVLGKAKQFLTVQRMTRGTADAHGVKAGTLATIVSGVPCMAEEHTGREVLSAAGDRVIGDWSVYLLDNYGILAEDRLTISPGNIVIYAINHPNANAIGRVKAWEVIARSGAR